VLASYLGRGGTSAEVPAFTDEDPIESNWTTALEVAAAADQGNLIHIFRLLDDTSPTVSAVYEHRWKVLARCCFVPAINVIRIGLVRRYNKSFGKLEKVPGEDLARLLCLPSAESAVRFCSDIGLPTEDGKATMKAAPISITDKGAIKRMTNPGRAEDEFVFGRQVLEQFSGVKKSLPEPSGMKPDKPSSLASASCMSSVEASSVAASAVTCKPSSLATAAKKSSLAAAAAGPKKVQVVSSSTKTSSLATKTNTNKRWGDDSDSDGDDWENAADDLKYDRAHPTNAASRSGDETLCIDQDAVLIPPAKYIWDIIC